MTPDEKKLYALMAVAEQQQNLVNQAVKSFKLLKNVFKRSSQGKPIAPYQNR